LKSYLRLKGQSIQRNFLDVCDELMEFNPPFVDVTYHQRRACVYKNVGNGLVTEESDKKTTLER
jgi:methylenetetrahydrofolate reductase (NADPH)